MFEPTLALCIIFLIGVIIHQRSTILDFKKEQENACQIIEHLKIDNKENVELWKTLSKNKALEIEKELEKRDGVIHFLSKQNVQLEYLLGTIKPNVESDAIKEYRKKQADLKLREKLQNNQL